MTNKQSKYAIFALYGRKNKEYFSALKFFKRNKYIIISTINSIKKLQKMLNSNEPFDSFRTKALKLNKNFWINMALTSTKETTNVMLIDDVHELEKDLQFIKILCTESNDGITGLQGLSDQEIEIKIKKIINS